MPITVSKTKAKEDVSPLAKLVGGVEIDPELQSAIEVTLNELLEELEAVEAAKQLVKTWDAKRTELADAITMTYDHVPAEDPIEIATEKGKIILGPVGTSRSIKDLDKVKAILGTDVFMKLAKVTLTDIDKYLTLPQRMEVLEELPGKRTIKIEENKANKISLTDKVKKAKK